MTTRRRKVKKSAIQTEFAILFDHLWKDPKYVALDARKDRILHAWNVADAYKSRGPREREKARRLDVLASKVLKRLHAYEERTRLQLQKAGVL